MDIDGYLRSDGYIRISTVYINGEYTKWFIHQDDMDVIQVVTTDGIDDEVLWNLLGLEYSDILGEMNKRYPELKDLEGLSEEQEDYLEGIYQRLIKEADEDAQKQ